MIYSYDVGQSGYITQFGILNLGGVYVNVFLGHEIVLQHNVMQKETEIKMSREL